MSGVDDRIVSMEFDNESFERKLASTLNSLDKLSESLQFVGAEKGFDNIASAADGFNPSHMADAIDNISSKFSALGAIGFSVIQSLTTQALQFAQSIGGDILGPVITGGKTRASNIDQAKFMFAGLGIDVQQGMDSALAAVRGTAFGLDEAAKAAAQFGASGIMVGDQMTGALRGVAGAAAMTGSSFSEMADIFAGSAGSGKVTNMDLMQFATRGLNAAAAVGKVMGKTEIEIHAMATAGTLDFKTFADAMDQAFGSHATEANQTYTGSLANLHAAMSRMGASFFSTEQIQQRDLFNALGPVIDKLTAAFQPLIGVFLDIRRVGIDKAVGFLATLDFTNVNTAMLHFGNVLKFVFGAVGQFTDIIKSSFRIIFPPSTTSTLIHVSILLEDFARNLSLGGATAGKIGDIFVAFFGTIKTGWTIIKEIVLLFAELFGSLSGVGSGALDFSDKLAGMIIHLNYFLVEGGGIHNFFLKLRDAIKSPIDYIVALKNAVIDFFNNAPSSDAVTGGVSAAEEGLNRFTSRLQQLKDTWDTVSEKLRGVFNVLGQIWDYISTWFKELGSKIANAFKPGDFNAAVDVINLGLLGGIALMFQKFLAGGFTKFGTGFIAKVTQMFNGVTLTLKAMQTELKAEALEKIAIALAVLTASIVVLSLIDSAALTKALFAIAVGFKELMAVLLILDSQVDSVGAAGKVAVLSGALIAIASAMVILSVAIKILSTLDTGALAKGLIGITVGLGLLASSTNIIAGDSAGMITAGIAMGIIASALIVLSLAVKEFSKLGWAEMLKGMVGIAAGLIILSGALDSMPPSGAISAIGLIELSIGLIILAEAVKQFSQLGWAEMAKGLVGITASLLIITAAMDSMPLTTPITAAGLVILGGALMILAEAVKMMGTNDLGTLAKGIGAITILLLILSAAMESMLAALPGAVALVVVAGALLVLADVLKKFGELTITEIVQGLLAIAGVLVILGLGAAIMEPLIPALFLLGVALGTVGAAFALFGVGAFLVAKAFEEMASAGVDGAKAIVDAIKILVTSVPEVVNAIAQSVLETAQQFLEAAPLLIRLVEAILEQLLDTVIKLTPKIGKAFGAIVSAALVFMQEQFPDLVNIGFLFLMSFLKGVNDNINELTTTVSDIVIGFLDALDKKIPEIATAVFNFVLSVAEEVARKSGEMQTAFIPIGQAFIDGLIDGVNQNFGGLISWFADLPGKILDLVKALFGIASPSTEFASIGVDIIAGLLMGLVDKTVELMGWFIALPVNILSTFGDVTTMLSSKGIDLIAGLLSGLVEKAWDLFKWFVGLPSAMIDWLGDLVEKFLDIGRNIIKGIIEGVKDKAKDLKDTITSIPGDVLDTLASGFGINSPSRKTMEIGNSLIEGFVLALNTDKTLAKSVNKISKETLFGFQTSLSQIPKILDGMDNFSPTITPILDLTKIEEGSKLLDGFMNVHPITPQVSLDNANVISKTAEVGKTGTDTPVAPTSQDVTFNQYNTSPTALSVNDVYRNTKSQIALAKEELKIA